MANPDWARWIFASLAYNMKTVATNEGIPALVEGNDRRTDSFMSSPLRAEIRINGPYINEQSKDYYQVWAVVNILLSCHVDDTKNAYRLQRIAGAFQAAIDASIPLYNYGGEDGDYDISDPDSQIHLGCLRPRNTTQPAVKVLHFGQVDKTEPVRQSVVDAELETFLEE